MAHSCFVDGLLPEIDQFASSFVLKLGSYYMKNKPKFNSTDNFHQESSKPDRSISAILYMVRR